MLLPNEIAEVANQVNTLTIQANVTPNRLDRAKLIAEALQVSCSLLSRLTDDDIYFEYERAVLEGNRESFQINRELTGGAIQLVSMEMGHFEEFLHLEITLLGEAGFDKATTIMLREHIQHRIEHIREHQVTGPELKRAVARLQRYVCPQSEVAAKALQIEQKRRSLLFSLVGMGSISANILAANTLSPIGVSASAGIGGALVADSVKSIIENTWNNKQRKLLG